ncbi:DMT family transporter [uncultured Roseobacter sp.]|uniref:DMT family transporter n=1 Tax=uncultured Roseobacter sp. TaxID=114847 RepID=UPI0026332A3C|nr:DMT family transporter [uncultured Roseobacter sp.]
MSQHSRREIIVFSAVLIIMGAGWGATQPLAKIAVSTGYKHFGLIFWQLFVGALLMAVICALRGTRLPRGRRQIGVCLMVATVGTMIPNTTSYQAAVHLPSGILSILLSMVPMWAFPIALAMKLDQFSVRRFFGLLLGLCGVLLIAAPGASALNLSVFWVLIGLVSGICYGLEGNLVAKFGTAGMDPFQVLYGASLMGAAIMLPVAIASGQWIAPVEGLTREGSALVLASVIHVVVYAGYVWLVGRAGSVFAVQVSYLVTGFGVIWAKLILDEAYSAGIWGALLLMFAGMYLVQPRAKAALAPA